MPDAPTPPTHPLHSPSTDHRAETPAASRAPRRTLLDRLVYTICWRACLTCFTLFYRMRIVGMENIPDDGPLLVIGNHQSHFDPPALGMAFRRRLLHFLAREGLFKNRFFGWLIRTLGSLPVSEKQSDAAAIRTSIDILKAGHALLMFPEGSRCDDGSIEPFKRGVWLLISRSGADVIPMAIEGAFDAWPRTRKFPYLFGKRLAVAVGRPIKASTLAAMKADDGLEFLRQTIDRLRLSLRDDLRRRSRGRYPAPGPADHPAAATTPRPTSQPTTPATP